MKTVAAVIVLWACATAVGAQQVPFDQVVERLKLPDASARMAALRLLEEAGYPEAGEPIAALLSDPDDRLQRAAVYAELGLFLGARIETRRRVALVVEMRDSQPAARAFDRPWESLPITPVPMAVVTGLLGPIGHPDLALRLEAAYALGILGQIEGTVPPPGYRAVAEAFAERLADPSPAARIAFARAGGRIFRRCAAPCDLPGLDRFGDALVHTLNDPERDVRGAALEAIGDIRWARAAPSITAAYEYFQKGPEALASLVALARIGHPSSAPVFRAALSRTEDAFRGAAAEGLARIGGADAAVAAQALATVRSRELLVAQAFAAACAGDTRSIDRVVQAVEVPATRVQGRDYLIEMGPPAATRTAAALGAAGSDTRLALIDTLSVIGGSGELATVEAFQNDKDAKVASAASRAARRIKARSAR